MFPWVESNTKQSVVSDLIMCNDYVQHWKRNQSICCEQCSSMFRLSFIYLLEAMRDFSSLFILSLITSDLN